MSISGVGGTSSWFTQWSTIEKTRAAAAQQATAASALLGQSGPGTIPDTGTQAVSGTSASSTNGQGASSFQQTMDALSADLKSGDVQAAQADFAKLQQLAKGSGVQGHHHHHHGGGKKAADATDPTAASSAASTDPFASAFGSLGQSLQNGDVSGAQTALTQLSGLLQSAGSRLAQPVGADSPANPAGSTIDRVA